MKLRVRAEVDIAKDPASVFDFAVALENMPKIFPVLRKVPGVTRAEIEGGGPQREGAIRKIYGSDGSSIVEEILALERPRVLRYRIARARGLAEKLLLRGIVSEWTFEPRGSGTRVAWTANYELRTRLAAPLIFSFINFRIRGLMQTWLGHLRDNLAT